MISISTATYVHCRNNNNLDCLFNTVSRKRWHRYCGFLVIILLYLSFGSPARAQTRPAGIAGQELQRQQERERVLRGQQERTPDVHLQHSVVDDSGGRVPESETPCFNIREIVFDRETPTFAWALRAADVPDDPVTGRCLGSKGINLAMTRIQNAIIARGYITTRVLAERGWLIRNDLGLRGSVKRMSYDVFAGQPLYKPDGFNTPKVAAGFNLTLGF
jgi:hemolysin activation/secretion protein